MSKTAEITRTIVVAHPSPDLYGSDRVLLETVSGMVARGWSVMTILPLPGPLSEHLERIGSTVRYAPMPVLRKSIMSPRGAAKFMLDVVRGIRVGTKLLTSIRPDAVFVNTLTIPLWIGLGRLAGKPVMVHVHESERHANFLLRFALAAPATFCRKIITNSAYSTESLVRYAPWLRKRTKIIYNGVPGPNKSVAARGKLVGPVRLLFVGRLSARKGAHIAIEAVRQLQTNGVDAQLDLLGAVYPGYEWFEERLRSEIASLPDPSKVRLVGFDSNVWPHYEACDIALVPSTVDEPFGNTAAEAILAERPVVVSQIGGLPEAASGFESAVLVAADNTVALTTGIQLIINSWSRFHELAALSRSAAEIRYSPELFGRSIADEVESIITR